MCDRSIARAIYDDDKTRVVEIMKKHPDCELVRALLRKQNYVQAHVGKILGFKRDELSTTGVGALLYFRGAEVKEILREHSKGSDLSFLDELELSDRTSEMKDLETDNYYS